MEMHTGLIPRKAVDVAVQLRRDSTALLSVRYSKWILCTFCQP